MITVLKVARLGHPVLRQVAEPVSRDELATREFQDFIDSMLLTMAEYSGVGLAAPQVHVGKRIVVFDEGAGLEDDRGEPILCLVNPEIEALTDETASMWEGCLSVPGLRGKVSRPAAIRLKGRLRDGREITLELEDFDAVVAQHECDHLDGVLYVDRLDSSRDLAFEQEFERYLLPQAEAEGVYVDDEG